MNAPLAMTGVDPPVDALYARVGYRMSEPPGSAVELCDLLGELGYLQDSQNHLRVADALDGDSEKILSAIQQDLDGSARAGAPDSSFRCDEGAVTPSDRTVEEAADTPVCVGLSAGGTGASRAASVTITIEVAR